MAEIFDFKKAREKRENPQGIVVGDQVFVQQKNESRLCLLVEKVEGSFAYVKLVDDDTNEFVWITPVDTVSYVFNHIHPTKVPLSLLKKL